MRPRLLIADDDEGIRDIFQLLLEKEGYDLDLKATGDSLLTGDYTRPDLFIIDKQLSGLDGLDICRHLKSNSETASIPVIMVSASPDIGPLSQQVGADDYLEKPFDINGLLEMIRGKLQQTGQKSVPLKVSFLHK